MAALTDQPGKAGSYMGRGVVLMEERQWPPGPGHHTLEQCISGRKPPRESLVAQV